MIFRLLHVGAFLFFSGAISVFASSPMSQLAEIESVGDVESCFAAPFDTYDSWLQSRAAENHHFNEGSFKEQIPRQDYVRYSDRLDLNVPILLLHGTYDERASAMGALRFARLLQERWHPYRLVMFENDDHFLSDHQKEMREIVTEWFARYLR